MHTFGEVTHNSRGRGDRRGSLCLSCGSRSGLLRATGDYKGNERESECVLMDRVDEDSPVVAGDAVVDATL